MKLLANWPHMRLGDISLKIGSGSTPRGGDSVYQSEGPAIIRSQNVYNGVFNYDGLARLSNEHAEQLAGVTVEAGDILLNITGDSVARCCQAPGSVLPARVNQHVAIIRPDREKLNPQFLCYYLISPLMQAYLLSIAGSGGTRKALTKGMIEELHVPSPSQDTQKRIVEIVGTYDALIENNRRRMGLLEESARLLYQEWFVRLRFPGYEHVRIADGVPEGWERRPLGQCVTFLSGGTPSKSRSDFWEGDIPWISSGEMTIPRIHDSTLHVTAEAIDVGSRLVPADTILAVVRGMSLAKEFRVCITARPVSFNQDLKAFACESTVNPVYLFNALLEQRDQIRDRATEASHGTKKLDTPVLASVPILLPPSTWQTRFLELVDPLNASWDNLYQQNQKLRAARDLLLPRLMSGEVAV